MIALAGEGVRGAERVLEVAAGTGLVTPTTGFPGHRRFTARSLRASLEARGLRVVRAETLPGLIPIGYFEGSFGAA